MSQWRANEMSENGLSMACDLFILAETKDKTRD